MSIDTATGLISPIEQYVVAPPPGDSITTQNFNNIAWYIYADGYIYFTSYHSATGYIYKIDTVAKTSQRVLLDSRATAATNIYGLFVSDTHLFVINSTIWRAFDKDTLAYTPTEDRQNKTRASQGSDLFPTYCDTNTVWFKTSAGSYGQFYYEAYSARETETRNNQKHLARKQEHDYSVILPSNLDTFAVASTSQARPRQVLETGRRFFNSDGWYDIWYNHFTAFVPPSGQLQPTPQLPEPSITWNIPAGRLAYTFSVELDSTGMIPTGTSFPTGFTVTPSSTAAKSYTLTQSSPTGVPSWRVDTSGNIRPIGRVPAGVYALSLSGKVAATDSYRSAGSSVGVIITVAAHAGNIAPPTWDNPPFTGSIPAGTTGPYAVGSVSATGADTYRLGADADTYKWAMNASTGLVTYTATEGIPAAPGTIAIPVVAEKHVGSREASIESVLTVTVTPAAPTTPTERYHAPVLRSAWNPGTGWVKDSQGRWTISVPANSSGIRAIDMEANGGAWDISSQAPLHDSPSYAAHPSPATGRGSTTISDSVIRIDPISAGTFQVSVALDDGTTTTAPIVFILTYTAPTALSTTLQWYKQNGATASPITSLAVSVPENSPRTGYFTAADQGVYLEVTGGVQNRGITPTVVGGGRYMSVVLGGTANVSKAGGGTALMRRVDFFFWGSLLNYEGAQVFSATVRASTGEYISDSNSYASAEADLAINGTVTNVEEPPVWNPSWVFPYAVNNNWHFRQGGTTSIQFDISTAATSPEGRTVTWGIAVSDSTKISATRTGNTVTVQIAGAAAEGDTGTVSFTPSDGTSPGETRTVDWSVGARELITPQIAFSNTPIAINLAENTPVGTILGNITGYVASTNQQISYGALTLTFTTASTILAEYVEIVNVATPNATSLTAQLRLKKSPDFEVIELIGGYLQLAMAASHNAAAVNASQEVSITITNIDEPVHASSTPLPDYTWNVTRAQELSSTFPELLVLADVTDYFTDPEGSDYTVSQGLNPRTSGDTGIATFRRDGNKLYMTPTTKQDATQTVILRTTQAPDGNISREFTFRINAYQAAGISITGGLQLPGRPALGSNVHNHDIPADPANLPEDITIPIPTSWIVNSDNRPLAIRDIYFPGTDHITWQTVNRQPVFTSSSLNLPVTVVAESGGDETVVSMTIYTTDRFTEASTNLYLAIRVT